MRVDESRHDIRTFGVDNIDFKSGLRQFLTVNIADLKHAGTGEKDGKSAERFGRKNFAVFDKCQHNFIA